MKLADLLAGVTGSEVTVARGVADLREVAVDLREVDREVREVREDSRAVEPGDVFVAIAGQVADGRKFIDDAIARGASAVVIGSDRPGIDRTVGTAAASFRGPVVTVPNARHALALMAANRFASARDLVLTAVTGTNGKTTTTYLMESMLMASGIRAGVVGTIAYRVEPAPGGDPAAVLRRPAPLTTPGAPALHAVFAEMRAVGAGDVVLEASSIALEQSRLDGCRFRVAGLTNVTQDHLDYHGNMDRYFDAKAILFDRLLDPHTGVAVLPVDLAEGRAMRARVAPGRPVIGVAATVGAKGADVVVESARLTAEGVRARVATPAGPFDLVSPLVGDYNLANLVLAAGMGVARGLGIDAIATGLSRVKGVPGRLEPVVNGRGVLCVVDYAHTPDALERAQAALRPLVTAGGRLVTLFGCGGDRDRGKRPLMGEAAARGSDLVIVTSDNPRTEDPDSIITMIVEGVKRGALEPLTAGELGAAARGYHVVADRRRGIQLAVGAARPGDAVLLAGKGHEDYQIVGATRLHFDDREEAAAAFTARDLGAAPAGAAGRTA